MMIELFIEHEDKVYTPTVIDQTVWETEISGVPGKLTFKILCDKEMEVLPGDVVKLFYEKKLVFKGYIFHKVWNSKESWSITAYDMLRYFKNRDSYKFNDMTASAIIKKIAGDFKFPIGTFDPTDYVIPSRIERNTSLFEIAENTLKLEKEHTGNQYVLYDDCGKLCLRHIDNLEVPIILNAHDSESYRSVISIDSETYNKIKLKDEEKENHFVEESSERMEQWGVLQYYDTVAHDENGQEKAKSLLKQYNRTTREFCLEDVLGEISVRAGCQLSVLVNRGNGAEEELHLVESCRHVFDKGRHTMTLDLYRPFGDPKKAKATANAESAGVIGGQSVGDGDSQSTGQVGQGNQGGNAGRNGSEKDDNMVDFWVEALYNKSEHSIEVEWDGQSSAILKIFFSDYADYKKIGDTIENSYTFKVDSISEPFFLRFDLVNTNESILDSEVLYFEFDRKENEYYQCEKAYKSIIETYVEMPPIKYNHISYVKEFNPETDEIDISENGSRYVKNQLLIGIDKKSTFVQAKALFNYYKADIVGYSELISNYQIEFKESKNYGEIKETGEKIRKEQGVLYVNLNFIIDPGDDIHYVPRDPWSDDEGAIPDNANYWSATSIRADEAWGYIIRNLPSDRVRYQQLIGIIDSGSIGANRQANPNNTNTRIRTHDDLWFSRFFDTTESDHGTQVAGIIGARQNNRIGITGIGRNVRLGIDRHSRDVNVLADSIGSLLEWGARVINISQFSAPVERIIAASDPLAHQREARRQFNSSRDSLQDLLTSYVDDFDFLIVVSAGNTNNDNYNLCTCLPPDDYSTKTCTDCNFGVILDPMGDREVGIQARYNHYFCNFTEESGLVDRVIVVGSCTSDNEIAGHSNINRNNADNTVDVVAPGEDVYTTHRGNTYTTVSGTSFAAPHVTGVVALMYTVYPELRAEQAKEIIVATSRSARNRIALGDVNYFKVDAYSAVKATWTLRQLRVGGRYRNRRYNLICGNVRNGEQRPITARGQISTARARLTLPGGGTRNFDLDEDGDFFFFVDENINNYQITIICRDNNNRSSFYDIVNPTINTANILPYNDIELNIRNDWYYVYGEVRNAEGDLIRSIVQLRFTRTDNQGNQTRTVVRTHNDGTYEYYLPTDNCTYTIANHLVNGNAVRTFGAITPVSFITAPASAGYNRHDLRTT